MEMKKTQNQQKKPNNQQLFSEFLYAILLIHLQYTSLSLHMSSLVYLNTDWLHVFPF